MKTVLQIDLTFDQILSLIRQLPKSEKIKLSKELEKEVIDSKLSELLHSFKTDEIDFQELTDEIELVRQKLYEKEKS